MSKFIATFHSQFGAMSYFRALKKQSISAKLMPVPRKLSSSCGICCCYEHSSAVVLDDCEMDSVYMESEGGLECIIKK